MTAIFDKKFKNRFYSYKPGCGTKLINIMWKKIDSKVEKNINKNLKG